MQIRHLALNRLTRLNLALQRHRELLGHHTGHGVKHGGVLLHRVSVAHAAFTSTIAPGCLHLIHVVAEVGLASSGSGRSRRVERSTGCHVVDRPWREELVPVVPSYSLGFFLR